MIRTAIRFLIRLPGTMVNYPVGLFYIQWTHRYLLYFAACLLIGISTYSAIELYGWLTWRDPSKSFRNNHVLHTMMNFGFCLYAADEWLGRLAGKWGRFENRTLGKQALIWGISFIGAFYVQRTIVYEGIKYYAFDTYHFYEKFPQLRPRLLDHFLFCLPFMIGTILFLWLLAFVRQRGLVKERIALASLGQALISRELASKKTASQKLPAQNGDSDEKTPGKETPGKETGGEKIPFRFQSGSSQIILDKGAITHITVEDHYCRIHTFEKDETRSFFVKSSLKHLLERLADRRFIRIHRSHVVNARAIERLDRSKRSCKVYLKSDAVLPVSRYRLDQVMSQMKDVLEPL